jgi:hypothetical protein
MDSTSAQGCIYKSNVDDSDQAIQMLIVCKMTEISNIAGIVLSYQLLTGKENIVSDCLSHDHTMPDPDLVHMLLLFIPEKIAADFTINQLPSKVFSFIFSLAQKTPETAPSPTEQPRTPCDPGNSGSSSVNNM